MVDGGGICRAPYGTGAATEVGLCQYKLVIFVNSPHTRAIFD